MPTGLGLEVGINAVSIIRKLRVGLVIGALIFLSPLAASVIVISGEIGLDLVAQAGTAGALDLGIAGVIGWMLFKKSSPSGAGSATADYGTACRRSGHRFLCLIASDEPDGLAAAVRGGDRNLQSGSNLIQKIGGRMCC